jgi:ribosome assembly protein 1
MDAPDPRQALRAVLKSWLPLSEAVLSMASLHLPSPPEAAPARVPRLLGLGVGAAAAGGGDRAAVTAAAAAGLAAAGDP